MIEKIISGGQYGADLAGLAVGKSLNISTGGMAPKGYITKYGKRPTLSKLGLTESKREGYVTRTYDNVKNSDGTMRFCFNFNSPGEICTLKAINQYNKPYIDIDLKEIHEIFIFDVIDWFVENKIQILNIAGNAGNNKRESVKIFNLVKEHLSKYIKAYNSNYDEIIRSSLQT
ncbi:MAG: YpsA SLOG family protein [bacterium]